MLKGECDLQIAPKELTALFQAAFPFKLCSAALVEESSKRQTSYARWFLKRLQLNTISTDRDKLAH